MTNTEWCPPPSQTKPAGARKKHDHYAVARKLKSDPGKGYYAYRGETHRGLVRDINQGRLIDYYPEGAFRAEAKASVVDGKRVFDIWVAYVGG